MTVIRVTHTVVVTIDTDKYLAAAADEVDWSLDASDVAEMRGSVQVLAVKAMDRQEEEVVPRWARDSVTLVSQSTTVEPVSSVDQRKG